MQCPITLTHDITQAHEQERERASSFQLFEWASLEGVYNEYINISIYITCSNGHTPPSSRANLSLVIKELIYNFTSLH